MQWLLINKKLIGYAAGAVALILSLWQLYAKIDEGGYQRAISDIREQQAQQLREDTQTALDNIASDNTDTTERVRIEYITDTQIKEVIKYVDREIIVPAECDALAANVVSVLSEATGVVGRSAKSADPD